MSLQGSPYSSRNQFPLLLKGKGLTGRAVEVGTHRGDFAAVLLKDWPGHLTCVDPWGVPAGYEYQADILRGHLGGGKDRDADYRAAADRVSPYRDRAKLFKGTSEQAAGKTDDGSLDFVYIDGDHEPPHPFDDILRWWPKLRPGGVLAGHDFLTPGVAPDARDNWGRYVQSAVIGLSTCVEKKPLDVFLIVEEGGLPWSYFMVKPE